MHNKFYFISLFAIVILFGYLCYLIFKPFLTPLAWAIVLAIVFYPLLGIINKYVKRASIASTITTLIILLIIIGPFSYISFLIALELRELPKFLNEEALEEIKKSIETPFIKKTINYVIEKFHLTEAEIDKSISENLSLFGKELLNKFTKSIGNIVSFSVDFLFMTIALFFILKDGSNFLEKIKDYLPFSEQQKSFLTSQIRDIIVSTIYGGVAVAIVQGAIGGMTFFFLGISSPALWGLAISVASFIPLIGAFGVWGPMTVYLFIKGYFLKGILLAIIGTFIISLIDNILKPIIIGGRTKMPVPLIFFSVLGGIQLFGLIGLIMGPLVVAIFISVIDIFKHLDEGGKNA
ncbi:MAG: AI-2E family transporter [Thermodesulfovibrionales bacterium]|nr:AI-2E family transporter [Thermodesulfovibrionales bacterium]